ncbi:MAG: deoxyribodipyrimidine photo-lyase/cryptochrome family protein [Pseudomonadota bacterium]
MDKQINIVWFKRDLRIQDHAALYAASQHGHLLPVFTWDESVWSSPDYSTQHVMFVRECLAALRVDLSAIGLTLYESTDGILHLLNSLKQSHPLLNLYSHEETGNHHTYALDIQVGAWCRQHQVTWNEYPQNGVVRRLKSRDTWNAIWQKRMSAPQYPTPTAVIPAQIKNSQANSIQAVNEITSDTAYLHKPQPDKPLRQKGGRHHALKIFHSFLNGRASRYRGGISSPISSEEAGSRISPYLAWGVLSIKEVIQSLRIQHKRIKENPDKYPKNLTAGLVGFESRLHWHCHFMQKLESEPSIEYQNLHPALNGVRDETYAEPGAKEKLHKWIQGKTGWPLVDACMAMLREVGWINFRMRAMLISTSSYLYWLHWREPGLHLAREFLDYEPGIHWPQVQMQSGTTGINTMRVYNPVKQAKDQDPEGNFVRKWIPALKNVPTTWIFEPWLMTHELQLQYSCIIGQNYPAPIVAIDTASRQARAKLSDAKHDSNHSEETKRIITKHASRKVKSSKKLNSSKTSKKQTMLKINRQQDLF